MTAIRVSRLHINEPIDLDARFATSFEPIRSLLFFVPAFAPGKNPLFQLVHGRLPRAWGDSIVGMEPSAKLLPRRIRVRRGTGSVHRPEVPCEPILKFSRLFCTDCKQ